MNNAPTPKMTPAQRDRIVKAAMRWYEARSHKAGRLGPFTFEEQMLLSETHQELSWACEACAAAKKGKKWVNS